MESRSHRDFVADAKRYVDEFIIAKFTKNMPFRLVDTYTGLILEQSDIVSLLKIRTDYNIKLQAAIQEAEHLDIPPDTECLDKHPKFDDLRSFIAEYLAYAMFSHRWRGREPSLDDVRKATHGIYSMDDLLPEEHPKIFRFSQEEVSDLPSSVQKLQEFCCLAAKCGFRWAWSDTCCINKKDYAETSESINCMFLWYRSSELTIVYLDDVDDVEEGRLSVTDGGDSSLWFEETEIREPLPSSDPSAAAAAPSDIYVASLETKQYLSLYDRLRNGSSPQLRVMQPDSQVEGPRLRKHLIDWFPELDECTNKGIYRKLPVWVTRGWTLQEMLASKRLRFYSKQWTLLEEANDFDTDEEEKKISISSFRYRARLIDHRTIKIWENALWRTTGIRDELVGLKVGTRDVRTRLRWAARRATTKVEDMAYCLLGIFDISLPAVYGEGPRAFFRLQEELIKRTGDVSLFDWCGRNSTVNTFLASSTDCFLIPNLPEPELDDSNRSIFWMIMDLFRAIFRAAYSAVKAAVCAAKDWITNIMKSPPPGHSLVNGGLNLSLFEHQIKSCKPLKPFGKGDTNYHYQLEVKGLKDTTVTFSLPSSGLMDSPTEYYLCRAWNQDAHNVFQIFLELIEYVLKEALEEAWNKITESGDSGPVVDDEKDDPESKLRHEMQMKRKEVMKFFQCSFPVYLIHVRDGRAVRVPTARRVVSDYSRFDFTMPVVTQLVL